MTELHVGGAVLDFLAHPPYAVAHPGEAGEEPCERCALARRRDTGETVLLWCCGGLHWSVSRHDPDHDRHRTELLAHAA